MIKSNDRIFICGKTGSGKSYLLKNLIIPQLQKYVIVDYKIEYTKEYGYITHYAQDVKNALQNGVKKIVYQPINASVKDFNLLCYILFRHKNITLIVDEIARYTTPSYIPPYFDNILRMGRSLNIGSVIASQRPRFIHNNILSECEHFFIFHLNLDTDKQKLKAFCGSDLDLLHQYQTYTFYYYNIYGTSRFGRIS